MAKKTRPKSGAAIPKEPVFQGLPFTKNGLPRTRPGVNGHTLVKLPFTKRSGD